MKIVRRVQTHCGGVHESEAAARQYLEELIEGAIVSIYDELSITPGRHPSLEVLRKHARMTMPRIVRYQEDLKVEDETEPDDNF